MSDSGPRIPPQVAVTVPLSGPIKAHGEEVAELTIQPPPRQALQEGEGQRGRAASRCHR